MGRPWRGHAVKVGAGNGDGVAVATTGTTSGSTARQRRAATITADDNTRAVSGHGVKEQAIAAQFIAAIGRREQ